MARWSRRSRAVAYQALGPLAFQRATLKSWEWPGDEAKSIMHVYLPDYCYMEGHHRMSLSDFIISYLTTAACLQGITIGEYTFQFVVNVETPY